MLKLITSSILILLLSSCHEDPIPKASMSKIKQDYLFKISSIKSPTQPFLHQQQYTQNYNISEPLGSGLAAIDANNDGRFEVFFAQYDKNHSHSILYRIEDEQYIDITKQSGLDNLTGIIGASVGDINNDGWSDLIIYGYQKIHLFINNNGYFNEVKLPIFGNNSFFTSATFFNANNDKYLDLYLSRYVETDLKKPSKCIGSDQLSMYCSPSAYPFQKDYLLINNKDNSFTIATNETIEIYASPSLGVVASDFNNDGLQDIYVANDGQDNFLFSQQSNGTFIEQALQKSVASNLAGLKEASMGIAVGDYDNNGLTDLFLTHLKQETNTLYSNQKEWFSDVTNITGLATDSRIFTGFGTGMYDLNNDNWLDLFIVNGSIQPDIYKARKNINKQFNEMPLLYINKTSKFERLKDFSNQQITKVGRGLIFIDKDNDGDLDMISNNNNQAPTIYTNQTNPMIWYGIEVKCYGRNDFGAKIKFSIIDENKQTTFHKTVHSDGSYASASDPRVIISLLPNEKLDQIEIFFTNKTTQIIDETLIKKSYSPFTCKSDDF